MKKLLSILIAFVIFLPTVQAVTIRSDYAMSFKKNSIGEMATMVITAEKDFEISAKHGINLILDDEKEILWNDNEIQLSGIAIENERIESSLVPTFSENYKILHIPVLNDFLENETFIISGLKLRAYRYNFSYRFMKIDINGDGLADAVDINGYKVNEDRGSDITVPYPVTDIKYVINDNKDQISLSWNNPPDYDFDGIIIEKNLLRDGITKYKGESRTYESKYIDTDVQIGDIITYYILPRDLYNLGEKIELIVDLTETPTEDPIQDPIQDPADEELSSLSRLHNYYKIREEIKCLDENSSMCLWAKINLIYAQEKLEKYDIDISLSDRDLYLMGLRIKYPTARYQTNCVDAVEEKTYCSALGKSIDRVNYFLGK